MHTTLITILTNSMSLERGEMGAQLVKKYLIPNTALTSILKMMGEKYFIDIHINMTFRPWRGGGGQDAE